MEIVVIDVTETPIERPKKSEKRGLPYGRLRPGHSPRGTISQETERLQSVVKRKDRQNIHNESQTPIKKSKGGELSK